MVNNIAGPHTAVRASAMVSPTLAGEINRARVLTTLYSLGPLSRPELARATGSTRATIGSIVQPLLDEGVLIEGPPLAIGAQGGKPARPVWFADEGWLVGAMVLLPRRAEVALVSASGRVLNTLPVDFGPGRMRHDVVAERLADAMRALAGRRLGALRGVGVAVGGIVDTRSGDIVRVDLLPGLNGLGIGPILADALGVPTHVDNDARAQALGDLLFGLGRGYGSFCSLYVGEGIGAGFIFDGALHRGPGGAGGESGHMTVDRDGPTCTCGRTGCWEAIAATRWVRAAAAARGLRGARTMTVGRLSRRAEEGAESAALLAEYAANVAVGVANLQQLLGVGRFIVHGDPVQGGDALRTAIEGEVRARTLEHPGSPVDIVFADADDHATLRGAAAVVLSRALHVSF